MNLSLILKHIIIGGVAVYLGIQALRYTNQLILWFGTTELADKYLPGGTVTMWKLLGIALVIGGILILFGYSRLFGF